MARWTDLAAWRGPTENSGPDLNVVYGLVLHIAQGYFEGTISWQKNPDANTSSHFVGGRNPGERAQVVDTAEQAWCQKAGNSSWLSLELAGFVPDAMTENQLDFAARLLLRCHTAYGVPLRVAANPSERGLGHHSMDREGTDPEWGHDECPGSNIIAQKQQVVDRAIALLNGDDMEQAEKLIEKTDNPSRTVGHVFADLANLRNWYYSPPGGATIGIPPPDSVGAIILAAAQRPPVQSAPVDIDALVAALRPHLETAAEAAVRKVLGGLDGATPPAP